MLEIELGVVGVVTSKIPLMPHPLVSLLLELTVNELQKKIISN